MKKEKLRSVRREQAWNDLQHFTIVAGDTVINTRGHSSVQFLGHRQDNVRL